MNAKRASRKKPISQPELEERLFRKAYVDFCKSRGIKPRKVPKFLPYGKGTGLPSLKELRRMTKFPRPTGGDDGWDVDEIAVLESTTGRKVPAKLQRAVQIAMREAMQIFKARITSAILYGIPEDFHDTPKPGVVHTAWMDAYDGKPSRARKKRKARR